jgi:hypothetical protein
VRLGRPKSLPSARHLVILNDCSLPRLIRVVAACSKSHQESR